MLTWQDHTKAATVMLFRMENRNTAYVTLGRHLEDDREFYGGNLVIALILSGLAGGVLLDASALLVLPGSDSGFLSVVPYLASFWRWCRR